MVSVLSLWAVGRNPSSRFLEKNAACGCVFVGKNLPANFNPWPLAGNKALQAPYLPSFFLKNSHMLPARKVEV